mmetsp:Transcript_12941/g.30542  ORF Transcript_12941/g.30542 Transcript_12941/m.30542 type:complete len:210 (+) Transcript_12941:80-709(+)
MRRWPPSTSAPSSHRASSWIMGCCRTAITRDGSTSTCARRARWRARRDQLCYATTRTACLRVSPRACRTHSRRGRSTRGHGRSRRARRGRGRRAPKAVPRCGSPRPASGCGRADRRPRRGRKARSPAAAWRRASPHAASSRCTTSSSVGAACGSVGRTFGSRRCPSPRRRRPPSPPSRWRARPSWGSPARRRRRSRCCSALTCRAPSST